MFETLKSFKMATSVKYSNLRRMNIETISWKHVHIPVNVQETEKKIRKNILRFWLAKHKALFC